MKQSKFWFQEKIFLIRVKKYISLRVKRPEIISDFQIASEGKVMGEKISIFKWPRGFEMNFEGFDILKKNYEWKVMPKKCRIKKWNSDFTQFLVMEWSIFSTLKKGIDFSIYKYERFRISLFV